MNRTLPFTATCCFFVVLFSASAAAQTGSAEAPTISAETGWAAMRECAAIANPEKRHACTDDVLRKSGLLNAEAEESERRRRFGLARPAETTRSSGVAPSSETASPGDAEAESKAEVTASAPERKTPEPPQEDRIEVTLAKVTEGGDGKLALTTQEGAVWRQVESQAIRPVPTQGQTMTIERTRFGGYRCKTSRYVVFRCYRAR